jgi:hypothetical protein
MMLNLQQFTNVAVIAGGAIALGTLIKSVIEYTKTGAQGRAKQFEDLRVRFRSDEAFREICDLLDSDDSKLREIASKDKRDFLGFFEEIALMVNTGLMKKSVAHYMFGFYAVRCWESENFWSDVNRQSPYWALFGHFAKQMQKIETNFRFDPRNYRF